MNRKLIYTCSLISFFLMWGILGFIADSPREQPVIQTTSIPPDTTSVAPAVTANAAIPVTGETQPVAGILTVYALIGLGALCLIFLLLNAANKRTVLYPQRKEPPDQS